MLRLGKAVDRVGCRDGSPVGEGGEGYCTARRRLEHPGVKIALQPRSERRCRVEAGGRAWQ